MKTNRIYNIDFRKGLDKMKEGAITPDLFLTDPPYNIGFKYNTYDDSMTQGQYIDMIMKLKDYPLAIIHYPEETMKYFVPALGVPDEVICWCYNSNLPRQSRLINFYNIQPDFNKVKQPYKNPNDKRIKKLIEKGSTGTRMYDWFNDIQLVKKCIKRENESSVSCPYRINEKNYIIDYECWWSCL